MKHRYRWLILFAALGVAACQLSGPPAETATVTAPAATAAPETAIASATPLISAPTAAVPTATLVVPPTPGCATWFFAFRPGQSTTACPAPVVTVDAVGEDFVGGRVYRYGPTPEYPDQRGTVFVIYNNGTWETYVDTFKAGDPASDPSISPPAGRTQPSGAIGKVWRENPAVRQALGWAYGPEQSFTGRYQDPQADAHNIYVDHGKGLVLLLVSVDGGRNTWKVVGDY